MTVGPDFVSWMQQEVNRWADNYGTDARRAFPAWCLNYLFDVDEDEAFNHSDTLTQGDAGLDGWYFDRESGVFHLVQAKYLDDPASSIPSGLLDALLRAALLLKDPSSIEDGPHQSKLTSVALNLQQALLDELAVSLDFFVAGTVSSQVKEELEAAVSQLGQHFSAAFYDLERLYTTKLQDDPIADLAGEEVGFEVSGASQAYFERLDLDLDGVEKAAVTAIDGRSLGNVVDSKGPRLFHSNVRYYLRRQNRVNKAMLETLDDLPKRRAFWLYNNGITIVAEEFRFETSDGTTTLFATNPQIVNGAQTSSVLRERRAHLEPGDVSVQTRIIAVTSDAYGRDALEKISEYTNSQSPVRAGDLRSNDRRHKTLQSAFAMLTPPVFYERRRGEWLSLTAAARAQYQGGRVTKEDIGQRFLAFMGRPAEAITKKDSIFGGELESEAFDTSMSAQVYMLADALYRQADDLMKESNSDKMLSLVPGFSMKVSTEQDAPTQLAALRRMRKLACAHATALAREVLRARYHEVGEARAKLLRERLADPSDPTSKFIWRQVFKAIRQWMSAQSDKSALKANMQRLDAIAHMQANLLDALADANMEELPALSS